MRVWLLLVPGALLCAPVWAQEPGTVLRHDNFLVFEGRAGENVRIVVTSISRGPTYAEDLQVEVIDSSSERTLRRIVRLGGTEVIDYPVRADGLHAVRISSGWNAATARIEGAPWAIVAWRDVPVSIVGSMAPQYFRVPAGVESFRVALVADVTGEGATLRVLDPEGTVVLERTGDFDQLETFTIEVPAGADDATWSLSVTDPEQEGLTLDDVTLYLAGPVPPLLCEDPGWAEIFAAGEEYQPDEIDTIVEVRPGRQSLRSGESATLTWEMPAVPAGKVVALRITAGDVDYARELTVSINDAEPLAIPITGNETTDTFTLLLDPEQLRVGANTMILTHDPSGGSMAVAVGDVQVLIGARIREYKGY